MVNETKLGTIQGRISDDSGGRRNLLHDGNQSRGYATVSSVYRNDGATGTNSSSRYVDQEYRIRIFAYSAGLFLSGIIFSVIQIVR